MDNKLFKPIFNEQDELWNHILHNIDNIGDVLEKKYAISKKALINRARDEYKILEKKGLIGLYYLISCSLDEVQPVSTTEIVVYGSGNASLIINLIGLSGGVGAIPRIARIMKNEYYSKLFFGPEDSRLDFDLSIRMSNVLFKRFIEAFVRKLQCAENANEYNRYDYTKFETLRQFNLFFSSWSVLDELAYLEIRCPLASHVMLEDNEKILDIICQRSMDNKKYKFKILPEEYHEVVTIVNPTSKEELAYAIAIALIVNKSDYLSTHIDRGLYNFQGKNPDGSFMRVYAEDYLSDKNGESFMRQRTLCQANQIFPKCHIDRMIDLEWLFCSYYNMMYI